MARKMWKFNLDPAAGLIVHSLSIPYADMTRTHLATQRGMPCLWIDVDDAYPQELWTFQWVGTGKDREAEGVPHWAVYVGTVLLADDALVLHGYLWRPA